VHGVRRAHVDDIDVAAREQLVVRPIRVRNAEQLGELRGAPLDGVGDRDELAPRVTLVTGQMGVLRPGTGAEDSDSDRQGSPHPFACVMNHRVGWWGWFARECVARHARAPPTTG
jgi:hypothetical protein